MIEPVTSVIDEGTGFFSYYAGSTSSLMKWISRLGWAAELISLRWSWRIAVATC